MMYLFIKKLKVSERLLKCFLQFVYKNKKVIIPEKENLKFEKLFIFFQSDDDLKKNFNIYFSSVTNLMNKVQSNKNKITSLNKLKYTSHNKKIINNLSSENIKLFDLIYEIQKLDKIEHNVYEEFYDLKNFKFNLLDGFHLFVNKFLLYSNFDFFKNYFDQNCDSTEFDLLEFSKTNLCFFFKYYFSRSSPFNSIGFDVFMFFDLFRCFSINEFFLDSKFREKTK
jgi:hypothetical protein